MREHEYDNRRVRTVLMGMIVDSTVLGRVSSWWKDRLGLFADDACNVIGKLCVDHYKSSGDKTAPDSGITSLYATWRDTESRSEDLADRVQMLLSSLSDEFSNENRPPLNPQLVVKQAKALFHAVRCRRLKDDIRSACDISDFARVDELAVEHGKSQVIEKAGVDLFNDPEAVKAVFNKQRVDSVVPYPGDIGEFFANQFCRGCFVSFMSPEGTGKSWFLEDVAFQSLSHRKRVAYIDTGDNTEEQLDERVLMRAAEVPLYSDDGKWPCEVKYPKTIGQVGESIKVTWESRIFKEPLSERLALAACEEMKRRVRSNRSYFRRICFPSETTTVDQIRSVLRSWAIDDFDPDLVVIDYADLIAASGHFKESRDKINDVWMDLRALSQEDGGRLIVTATQTNRESYDAQSLRKRHIGEDKRKLAAVTTMFGINATDGEKANQIYRINCLKRRRGKTDSRQEVWLAACLPLGQPAVLSLHRQLENTKEDEEDVKERIINLEKEAKKRRKQ